MKTNSLALITAFCFTILLAACKEVTLIDGAAFKEQWEESSKHSAVSWWYVGESTDRYFIAEKWPAKRTVYSISKQAVTIKGIRSFQSNSGNEPINLKSHNVVFE